MTIISPEPTSTSKVEPKVAWAAIGSYLAGLIALALVNAFTDNDNALLIASLPDAVEPFVLPVVPAIVALVSGYFARHQWRVNPRQAGSPPVG